MSNTQTPEKTMKAPIEHLIRQQQIYAENAAIQEAEGRTEEALNSRDLADSCGKAVAVLEAACHN